MSGERLGRHLGTVRPEWVALLPDLLRAVDPILIAPPNIYSSSFIRPSFPLMGRRRAARLQQLAQRRLQLCQACFP